jgi:hypothetical protein
VKNLPEVPLKLTRIGKQKKVRVEPINEARLLRSDGQEITYCEIPSPGAAAGERILVQVSPEEIIAVVFGLERTIPRPEPFQQSAGEAEEQASKSDDDFDWGFNA